jgi:hypothetical protein
VSKFLQLFCFVQPYVKRALRVPKTGREIGLDWITTAIKVNVILIFDTNQRFHVRLAFKFFGYEIRNRRIYNTYVLFNSRKVPTRN